MSKLTHLIIHCTATPFGRKVTSDDIRRWHINGRKWKQVGYSDMIHPDGRIENLVKYNDDDIVDLWEITNGVKGMNAVSRHVVYVGGLDPEGESAMDTRTIEQRESLAEYVHEVIEKHPDIIIAGHNQFDKKSCPCFDVPLWLESIGIDKKNVYLPKGYRHKVFTALLDEDENTKIEEQQDKEDEKMDMAADDKTKSIEGAEPAANLNSESNESKTNQE